MMALAASICLLPALLCACADPVMTPESSPQPPPATENTERLTEDAVVPPVEGTPTPVEEIPTLIYDQELVDPEAVTVRAELAQDRPLPFIRFYDGRPLAQLAAQYMEAYGAALLEASEREPRNLQAIEGFKLLSEPSLYEVGSADKRPFTFICSVGYAVKPLHYEQTNWWAGSALPAEEEGWLDLGCFLTLSVDEGGLVRFINMFSALGEPGADYFPLYFLREAWEVYSWFTLDNAGISANTGPWVEHNDNLFEPARFATMAELEAYVRQYFSAEITVGLLSHPNLAEIEGQLYVADSARGADIRYQGERWYIAKTGESSYTYTAEVDMLYPEEPEENHVTETYQFVLEYQEGVGWIFTRFEMFW